MNKVLVTGAAGFIGFHLAMRLLAMGKQVVGVDNLNEYYDVKLKRARLALLEAHPGFQFHKLDIATDDFIEAMLVEKCSVVFHLAAQAGVRYSIENPKAYAMSNLLGFANVLELCRQSSVQHLLYASTSSVYGANQTTPFQTSHSADHPLTFYAATKKSNEVMSHSYAHLFQIPCTGLRFFSVYGPYGRPDMAYFLFTKAILEGEKISVFNNGEMKRDFTYIDDIIESLVRLMDKPPTASSAWDAKNPKPQISSAPYRIFNIGNGKPVGLIDMITIVESALGIKAKKEYKPKQAGDPIETHADVSDLVELIGFQPNTPLEQGVRRFVDWYRSFYYISNFE